MPPLMPLSAPFRPPLPAPRSRAAEIRSCKFPVSFGPPCNTPRSRMPATPACRSSCELCVLDDPLVSPSTACGQRRFAGSALCTKASFVGVAWRQRPYRGSMKCPVRFRTSALSASRSNIFGTSGPERSGDLRAREHRGRCGLRVLS